MSSHSHHDGSNKDTGDYDLSFRTAAKVPAGDALTSAIVVYSSQAILNVTGSSGFLTTRSWPANTNGTTVGLTSGTFQNLTTLWANGKTFLDVVKDMTASPGTYIARVLSVNSPSGLIQGPFVTRVLNNTSVGPLGAVRGRIREILGRLIH